MQMCIPIIGDYCKNISTAIVNRQTIERYKQFRGFLNASSALFSVENKNEPIFID